MMPKKMDERKITVGTHAERRTVQIKYEHLLSPERDASVRSPIPSTLLSRRREYSGMHSSGVDGPDIA
jgi:hypothetical protein